jgi:hypothetical protein
LTGKGIKIIDKRKILFYLRGGEESFMIRAFNKHYRKAIDLLEEASGSEKIEMAEKVMDWFQELPEEYLISLALFFNEVIDDLGDESLEKINLKARRKKREEEEEEEEIEEFEEEEEEDEDDEKEDY